ncbi:HAMP domain-containing sensor histidine kinase [Paenibacillus motobuensis]|uniref:histidine kinase n=1 Tax=Paenibacillus motobuensis TaxID=295324 RepID=A0ABP3ILR7_9BACL
MQAFTLRLHLALALISIAAACVLGGLVLRMQERAEQVELQSVELLWNSYAKTVYEQAGSWEPMNRRLLTGAFGAKADRLSWESAAEQSASSRLQPEAGQESRQAKTGRSIPVLSGGQLVGYTQATAEQDWKARRAIVSGAALFGMLLYGTAFLYSRRMLKQNHRDMYGFAAEVCKRMQPDAEGLAPLWRQAKAADAAAAVQEALAAADRLHATISRLETVRRSMVADIAHELRTPIAIMRTQLDHALQGEPSLPIEKIVGLHDETLRLSKLVHDLQDLSLAESGNLPLHKAWFAYSTLIEEVLEFLSVEGEEQAIAVSFSKAREVQEVCIFADKERVRSILLNLLGNAFRHARSRVRVELSLMDSETAITVNDDGWGIEQEELPYVFDRFYRGRKGMNLQARGTGLGLGLAIVREYAQVHGGSVCVSSTFGIGTTFTLCLPVMYES